MTNLLWISLIPILGKKLKTSEQQGLAQHHMELGGQVLNRILLKTKVLEPR